MDLRKALIGGLILTNVVLAGYRTSMNSENSQANANNRPAVVETYEQVENKYSTNISDVGKIELTGKPEYIIIPSEMTEPPKVHEYDPNDWHTKQYPNYRQEFIRQIASISSGGKIYRNQAKDILGLFPEYMGNLKGLSVGDVGAGFGPDVLYWLEEGAEKVWATDIDPNSLSTIAWNVKSNLSDADERKVTLVKNILENPCLPIDSLDLVYMNQLHAWVTERPDHSYNLERYESELPIWWGAVNRSLRKNGKLIVIDFKPGNHRDMMFDPETAVKYIERNGFVIRKYIDDVPNQPNTWIGLFEKL